MKGSGGSEIRSVWWATLSGLCAILVGIGLSRFAYTPLLPALITAGWFTPAQAAYLGAANLAGYLVGALLAERITALAPAAVLLRGMMLAAALSFVACAHPLSFAWFFAWRFAAGFAGGILMVLAAPTVLRHVAAARRGLVGGVIFMGVGIGIVLSGTAVPLLLRLGLAQAWYGLGAISLLLTVIAWGGWPREPARPADFPAPPDLPPSDAGLRLRALLLEYGLSAVGLLPHMLFLVDFIARALGRGIDAGAWHWVLFGVGAIVGPVVFGAIGDRIGFKLSLRLAYVAQAAAVALIALSAHPASLLVSSVVIGAFVPGITVLTLGRLHDLIHDPDGRQRAWAWFTIAFAIGQAAAAYGFSWIFAQTGGDYVVLFALAAGAMLVALAIDLLAGRRA
jgi:predicted MFS family arabinose efflux permease